MNDLSSRRDFILTAGAAATSVLSAPALMAADASFPLNGRLDKTLKIGMVRIKSDSLTDRFKAAKAAGFGAIELSCPGNDVEEVKKAIAESGLPVDGSVCAEHWEVRHTDPDPEVRARALGNLVGALRETKAVGGHSVLLVVGGRRVLGRARASAPTAATAARSVRGAQPAYEQLGRHCDDHTVRAERARAAGDARIQQYLEWGINVTAVGIQNESNWSHPGTQTCRWDPERLGAFITERIKPRLEKVGLADLGIAAPDLAYVGHEASEVKRFLPTLTNSDTDIAAYHMYDSYGGDMDGSFEKLVQNTRELGRIRHDNFPKSRLWMTETTGAQWNSDEWHTYGWTREMTEHDKAIKAARYIHTTLADAEANAFLWWGLVYSLAPEKVTNPNTRQKHRDEGLVLVSEVQENARQKFLERTRKFYTFRQYSNFIKPGYRRVELREPEALQVSAFQSPDRSKLAVVVVNDTDRGQMLTLKVPLQFKVEESIQTDQNRSGESIDAGTILPPRSVRTVVFQKQ